MNLFPEVVGHDSQKSRLAAMVLNGRLPHALLFEGPEGVGKHTLAMEMSRWLLCADPASGGCGRCPSCVSLKRGTHPDFKRIEPNDKSNIRIEEIRGLIDAAAFSNVGGGRKVFVMDRAERMTEDAQNALLKIMEEPPKDVVLILVSGASHELLPTVLSRCQKVSFGPLAHHEVRRVLEEKLKVETRAASALASRSQGSLKRALFWKGQDPGPLEKVLLDALREASAPSVADLPHADQFTKEEAALALDILTELYRDAMIREVSPGGDGLLFYPEKKKETSSLLGTGGAERAFEALESIASSREDLEHSVNPRIVFWKLWQELGARIVR